MSVLLKDEEITNISDNIACSFIGAVAESGLEPEPIIKRAIAKAQLKKLVEDIVKHLRESPACSYKYCISGQYIEALQEEMDE